MRNNLLLADIIQWLCNVKIGHSSRSAIYLSYLWSISAKLAAVVICLIIILRDNFDRLYAIMPLIQLSPDSIDFPPVDYALEDPNGLLALGGDLSPERLLNAYHNGIFPWFSPDDPILWWSPDPRAILIPEQLHVSRSMTKFINKTSLSVTINTAFHQVIEACADERDEGTWIDPSIQRSYIQLYLQGVAHSVEVWDQQELVGGLYGVEQGSLFCGESMFSRQTNASKLALYVFCQHFIHHGGKLIDCQILNPHTESLGATEIPRSDYLQFLYKLRQQLLSPACWAPQYLR